MKQANGFPTIDPRAAQRAERVAQAKEQAKLWTNAMKAESLSAGMFSLQLPLVDGASYAIGATDNELRESGYAIVSHSSVPIGPHASGQPMMLHTFLVRALAAEAPRVLLA